MKRKHVVSILLIAMILVSSTNMVFAGESDKQYTTVNSHDYSFSNAALSLGIGARARVSIQNEDGTGGVPAGYMGGNAKMYFANGILSKSTGMQYTDKYMVGMTWYTDFSTVSGKYYAKSQVAFYNGNGYDRFNVNKSPITTYSNNRADILEEKVYIGIYKVNESGDTYGSELYGQVCDEIPDLILAMGVNGTVGYVRNNDLNPEPETIEEALKLNDITEIPLYKSDGETVIGVFRFNRESKFIE